MQIIYVLWLRELKRYWRSKAHLAGSLAQPLMYLLVLGFGLGPVYRRAGAGSFVQFMAPGVIAMTVLFSAVFCGLALMWDRQFGVLKRALVAPVPRIQVMIGRTAGAATVAVLQGVLVALVCLVTGFKPVSLVMLPVALVFLAWIAILFAGVGTALGSSLRDMQGYSAIMNFLVFPLFLLSGTMFPLDGLPVPLAVLTGLDPLSYGVDGLRATLIGRSYFGALLDMAVVVTAGIILTGLAGWRFGKIEI